ncbi:MAG: hypothetical protein ABSE49_30230 [Polyangiaceae bacterium]
MSEEAFDRRGLLKLAATAVAVGAAPGCASPQRHVEASAPATAADIAAQLDPEAAEALLAKVDARMDWIKTASLPDDVLPLSKLPRDTMTKREAAETDVLVRKAVRTLYMTGRFRDMPDAMKVHPGVQARLGAMQDEMDDAVLGMTDRLERMTPDDHRRVQEYLAKDDLFGERLARVLEKTASDDGLSFQHSFGLRSATLDLSARMAAQSPALVVDPLVRKVRRIEAHPRSDAEEARRLAARVGEETFWAHQERMALLHEAWQTRLGSRSALASGALASSTYVWPSSAPPQRPPSTAALESSDDESLQPPVHSPTQSTSGKRTQKAGLITMGFGLGSVVAGLICAGIATAPALSGFIWPALILGVTIGPILLVVGLIILIVGTAIRASE